MSTIAAVGAIPPPQHRAFGVVARAPAGVAKVPPAVIVDIGRAAVAAQTQSPLTPDKVDGVLSLVAGANGLAAVYANTNWAGMAAEFGKGAASRDKEAVLDALVSSASKALSAASSLGIPIHDSVSPDAVKNGAAPGTISLGPITLASETADDTKPDAAKLDVSA